MKARASKKNLNNSFCGVATRVVLLFAVSCMGICLVSAQSITEGFEGSVPNTGWTITTPGVRAWDKSTSGNGHTGSFALRCGNTAGADSTWLFTPAQTLTAGTTYSFNCWIKVSAYTTPQRLKITVGSAATVAGQTTTLWNCNNGAALTSNCWEWVNCRFTPSASGTYYFALCCYSASNAGYLYVDDVKLEAGCSSPLSGTVNVGSGQTYTSLTKAGGLFQKINSCGLSGNLTVNITSDLNEDGTYCISDWKNTAYSVTIQPDAAVVRNISGSCSFGLIRINGADKVIVNGNYAGSGQYLCIRNTNVSSLSSKVIGFRENSANCAIRNCRILNGNMGIHQADQADAFNTIANCSIEDFANAGILLYGGNNTTISANNIFQTTRSTEPGAVWGIYTNNATAIKIEKNKIYNLMPYYYSDPDPMWCDYYDEIGIEIGSLSGGVAVTASIKNNMIILTDHSSSWLKGIVFSSNIAGSTCDVCFNSVYIGGTTLNTSEYASGGSGSFHTPVSYCMYKSNGYTFNCYNNIMYNNRTSTVAARKNYAFYVSNSSNLVSDYNNLFAPQSNGYVGFWAAADYSTIAAWRTASGQDANSFNQDPSYINTTAFPFDLHIQEGMGLTGIVTCGITEDIDLQPRLNPNIGADELPNNNPVPVELLWFKAGCNNQLINLSWATATETNNAFFTIQKSNDNASWQSVTQIAGIGNSNTIQQYNFTDINSAVTETYYRLIQTDFDGNTETYDAISVLCDESTQEVLCYPNPCTNQLIVALQNIESEQGSIILRDISGRQIIYLELGSIDFETNTFIIELSDIASGVYSLEFRTGSYEKTMRVVTHD